jgi:hypothetical protein
VVDSILPQPLAEANAPKMKRRLAGPKIAIRDRLGLWLSSDDGGEYGFDIK